MPIITVDRLAGRTPAQKCLFIECFAQAAVETLGVSEDAVTIVLDDIAPEARDVRFRTIGGSATPST